MIHKTIILELYDARVIKVGQYRLRLGDAPPYRYVTTPFLIDVRVLISHPMLLQKVARLYENALKPLSYDRMAAIPYAALPIVGAISVLNKRPWIYPRREAKVYGTQKVIEGEFAKGDRVVLVDDTLTSGTTILEAIHKLRHHGLRVSDVVLLVDRGEDGNKRLEAQGIHIVFLFQIDAILEVLLAAGKITKRQFMSIRVGHTALKETVKADVRPSVT